MPSSSITNRSKLMNLYYQGESAYDSAQKAAASLADGIAIRTPQDNVTAYALASKMAGTNSTLKIMANTNETGLQSLKIASAAIDDIKTKIDSIRTPIVYSIGAGSGPEAVKNRELLNIFASNELEAIERTVKTTKGVNGEALLDGSSAGSTNLVGNTNFMEVGKGVSFSKITLGDGTTGQKDDVSALANIFNMNGVYFVTGKETVTATEPAITYNSKFVTEKVTIDLSNFVTTTVAADFLTLNGVKISTGAAGSVADTSITLASTAATPAALADALADAINLTNSSAANIKLWPKLEGFKAENETGSNIVTIYRDISTDSPNHAGRYDVAYDIGISTTTSAQIISELQIGNEKHGAAIANGDVTKLNVEADIDFTYASIAETVELDFSSYLYHATNNNASSLFTITTKDSAGADVSVAFATVASSPAVAAGSVTVSSNQSGTDIAKALAAAINNVGDPATDDGLYKAGFRAKAVGAKLYISRFDAAGSESYGLTVEKGTADIKAKVGNADYGTQLTNGDKSIVVPASYEEVVSVRGANLKEIGDTINKVISSSGQMSNLFSTKAQSVLSSVSSEFGTYEDTANQVSIDLHSNIAGFSGQIRTTDSFTGKQDIGDYGKASAGSLGIGNITVTGAPAGSDPFISWNSSSHVSSTDWFNIDIAKIKDKSQFQIGDGSGAKVFTFTLNPQENSTTDVQIVGATNASGVYDINYRETINNLVTSLWKSKDITVSGLDYETRYTQDVDSASTSNEGKISLQLKVSGRTASSSLNGLRVMLKDGVNDLDPQILTLRGGSSSGFDVSNIQNNPHFLGKINENMVSAVYKGNSIISLTIRSPQDENVFYSAELFTKPIEDTVVRFTSPENGYFDITLTADKGRILDSQSDADTYANDFGKMLNGISFSQIRKIDSFAPAAGASLLNGASVMFSSDNFSDAYKILSVDVASTLDDPMSTNKAYVKINVGGLGEFRNFIGENDTLQMISAGDKLDLYLNGDTNSTKKITIHFGQDIDLSDRSIVNDLQEQLSAAFKAGGSMLKFYVDTELSAPDSILQVSIPNLLPSDNGITNFDISTEDGAKTAFEMLEKYSDYVLREQSILGQNQEQISRNLESMHLRSNAFDDAGQALVGAIPGEELQKNIIERQQAITAMKMFAQTLRQYTDLVNTIVSSAAN